MPTATTRPKSKTRRARPYREPRFNRDTAGQFTAPSVRSIIQIEDAIAARKADGAYPDCQCEPYADVFTFERWKALGAFVRKGEKALRLSTWVPIDGKSAAAGDTDSSDDAPARPRLKPHTAFVFCHCQVDLK